MIKKGITMLSPQPVDQPRPYLQHLKPSGWWSCWMKPWLAPSVRIQRRKSCSVREVSTPPAGCRMISLTP